MWFPWTFSKKASDSWQDRAATKLSEICRHISEEWTLERAVIEGALAERNITGDYIRGLLSEEVILITELTAFELVEKIRNGEFSATKVTKAFCHRAAVAHQLNGCLHEIFFDEAITRAKELDEYKEKNNKVVGPLHGLPISLKDQFHVKDVETTMGYVGWIGTFEGRQYSPEYKRKESTTVLGLLQLGAVLYVKTSLPQTLLLGETHNNIVGYVRNPCNQELSCGGSSGGEGALLALGGSCLGIGTDIGGSVRIPAAFCGVYSIKPSVARFSYKDMANSNAGQTIVKSAVGFMSTSLSSLKLIQIALLSTKPWIFDSEVIPMPWRTEYEKVEKSLCFGLLKFDGQVMPHPPVLRALRMIDEALKKRGHKLVTWQPPNHHGGSVIHDKFMYCDGGINIWQQLHLSGEPLIDEMKPALGTGPKCPMSLLKFQEWCLKREAFRQEYREYWNSTIGQTGTGRAVDAFIMPVAPHAGVMSGKYFHYGYSDVINLLDYTSVVIPVTTADKYLDHKDETYIPTNEEDRKNWEAYRAEIYDGAPVGIQIVARQFQEERCLTLANEIEISLNEWKKEQEMRKTRL